MKCKIETYSARMCELGTKGCQVYHNEFCPTPLVNCENCQDCFNEREARYITKAIRFWSYSSNPEYFCFSNFFRAPIMINGKLYPSTEHYYQAMKSNHDWVQEYIRNLKTPREAADTGRMIKCCRKDWETYKIKIMYIALKAKFTQYEKLKEILLNTGNATLIEASPYDAIWGEGRDGKGLNYLGRLLMKLRKELKGEIND